MGVRPRLVALVLSLGPVAAHAQSQVLRAAPPVPTKGVRVFVCGHSFHVFIAEPLAALAVEAGLDDHKNIGVHFLGNSRPIRHWEVPDERNPVKRALDSGGVDVLTLVPHRELPDEGIDRFADLAFEKNPDVRVYLQLSWEPFDGKPPFTFRFNDRDKVTAADLKRMGAVREAYLQRLRAQVRSINERHGREFLFVVPAGTALERVREEVAAGRMPGIAKQSELFKDVHGHGSPVLQHLVSYCWFASVYRTSPVGLSALEVKGDETSHRLHRRLQEVAWDAVVGEPSSGVKAP